MLMQPPGRIFWVCATKKEPEPVPELVPELVPEPCLRAEHPSRCRAPRQGSPGAPEQEICL